MARPSVNSDGAALGPHGYSLPRSQRASGPRGLRLNVPSCSLRESLSGEVSSVSGQNIPELLVGHMAFCDAHNSLCEHRHCYEQY